MSAIKEKNNTWTVYYRFTDWEGERKQRCKRGFATKREALEWEREQLSKINADLGMTFESFVEIYKSYILNRIKESTWQMKENVIKTKLLPFFGKYKMNEITSKEVITWQNQMIKFKQDNGKPFSKVYLKTLHNQLSCIFNYAVKHYDLRSNPAAKVGNMGKKKDGEMQFWTKEEYMQFSDVMRDKDISYHAFQMLYWCGLRMGEMLALTPSDFDFEKQMVSITKSYQRLNGKDIITSPKTEKSNRVVKMPQSLCEEMEYYLKTLYKVEPDERIFPVTKSYLHSEMKRGASTSGVKRIRIHDLRHSHISLLIDRGFTPIAIADRVGHESINITLNYAHLFPARQDEMAKRLDMEMEGAI